MCIFRVAHSCRYGRSRRYFYSVDHDLRGRLGEIGGERRQVVIANAEYDYLTTTEEGRQTTEQIKGAEYTETKGIGHFPMSENHPVFKEYLQQVLQKTRGASGRPRVAA